MVFIPPTPAPRRSRGASRVSGAPWRVLLAELQERDATGEIAGIYAEIRRLWAVPYVSSLQRHLGHAAGLARVDVGRAGAGLHERHTRRARPGERPTA